MAFVKVAKKADVSEGVGTTVSLDGAEIALFNVNGSFYALSNTCPHRGGPLGEGICDKNIVTCPWHGWSFDITTGENTLNKSMRVANYPVKVEGDDLLVDISE